MGGRAGNIGGRVVVRHCFYIHRSIVNRSICSKRGSYALLVSPYKRGLECYANLQRDEGKVEINNHEFHKEERYCAAQSIIAGKCVEQHVITAKNAHYRPYLFPPAAKNKPNFVFACRETDPNLFCLPTAKNRPHPFFRLRRKNGGGASKPWCGKPHQALHLVVSYAQLWKDMCARATFHHLLQALVGGFRSWKGW